VYKDGYKSQGTQDTFNENTPEREREKRRRWSRRAFLLNCKRCMLMKEKVYNAAIIFYFSSFSLLIPWVSAAALAQIF
jgi:hypothetical protein